MDTNTAIIGLSGILLLVALVAGITFYEELKQSVKRLNIRRRKYFRKRRERILSASASEVLFRTAKHAKFIVDEKLDIPSVLASEKESLAGKSETMENA
jgi:hypothetical protein